MKVLRYYICDKCDNHFTTKQDINEPLRKKCSECGKNTLYQDLTGQHIFVYLEPTSVGHLAERNTERAGKYELESARAKMSKRKPKPSTWYNPESKDLSKELSHLNTKEKKQNYILKGE